jgi:glucosylceramidase
LYIAHSGLCITKDQGTEHLEWENYKKGDDHPSASSRFRLRDKLPLLDFTYSMFFSVLPLLAATQVLAVPSTLLKSRAAAPAAYVTTSDLRLKLSGAAAPVSGAGTGGSSPWSLSIDDTAAGHKQTIIGFGGSVTDATVTVLNALPADKRSQLLKELLTSTGADFSFLRHTIAASDLSGPPAYSYDDAGGNADPSLANFNLGDRGTAMAQMLATMRSVKAGLTILGSPWSAPGWMKLNRVSTYLPTYSHALTLALTLTLTTKSRRRAGV